MSHEGKSLFHVGTRDTCVRQNLTLGGVSFPRYTERYSPGFDDGDDQLRLRRAGSFAWLLPEQERRVREEIARTRQRPRRDAKGRLEGGDIVTLDTAFYAPVDGEEFLEPHVYIKTATVDEERTSWGAPAPRFSDEEEFDAARAQAEEARGRADGGPAEAARAVGGKKATALAKG